MLVDEFIELDLNVENAHYLIYTDYIKEYYNYFYDEDDYFTYEEYEEECELDEEEWYYQHENDDEEDLCLSFVQDNPDIQTIIIPIECLDEDSHELVDVQCDNCGKIYKEEYCVHIENYYDGYDDLCFECRTNE